MAGMLEKCWRQKKQAAFLFLLGGGFKGYTKLTSYKKAVLDSFGTISEVVVRFNHN